MHRMWGVSTELSCWGNNRSGRRRLRCCGHQLLPWTQKRLLLHPSFGRFFIKPRLLLTVANLRHLRLDEFEFYGVKYTIFVIFSLPVPGYRHTFSSLSCDRASRITVPPKPTSFAKAIDWSRIFRTGFPISPMRKTTLRKGSESPSALNGPPVW
jgi:hypothetical protein